MILPGDVKRRLTELGYPTRCELPQPGEGDTASRWQALFDLAACHDVSTARLIEAHVDAVSILHEAGREPVAGAVYGVWASAAATGAGVRLDPTAGVLSGVKPFCSGCGVVDRALIDVDVDGGRLLVDVDLSATASIAFGSAWKTPAMSATWTGTVEFSRHRVDPEHVIGPPGWYLDRVGFWHGACGPAACWAGAAAGLVDESWLVGADPYRRAHYGAAIADVWTMGAVLERAGREADAAPSDRDGAQRRAICTRYTIHELATGIVDRHARALGPRPFVSSSAVAQRAADTTLYLRQFHGERDLATLADTPGSHTE